MLKQSNSSQLLKQTKEPEVQLHSQDRSVAGRWHRGDTQNCWISVETEKNKQNNILA